MYIYIYIYILLQVSTKQFVEKKPFTVDVIIINGNGPQIQVCNLLILNTKNVAWLNWLKRIEISPQKCANLTQKILRGLATLHIYVSTRFLDLIDCDYIRNGY